MGRPPRHDVDRLLDAAVELAAAAGPRTLSMAAVARAAGAPSGSLYHRFPSRSSLLAALWLRTVERFQEGFLEAVLEEPPRQAAVAAARHVIAWSRTHPAETRLLLYGPADFGEPEWPAAARDRLRQGDRRIGTALRGLARRLQPGGRPDVERVLLATVDLPYATIRRHAQAGEPVPAAAEHLIAECVEALLTG